MKRQFRHYILALILVCTIVGIATASTNEAGESFFTDLDDPQIPGMSPDESFDSSTPVPNLSNEDEVSSIGPVEGAAAPGWMNTTVDTFGDDVGGYTSLALDLAGNLHISYYDFSNGDLKYVKWIGSVWYITTIDSAGDVGWYTSLAPDSANNPHISYYDISNGDLKYAKWTGSAWSISTVDAAGDVGEDTSLALDSAGNPHISYYDWTNGDLKYAKWTGSAWSISTVDAAGDVGEDTSLALDSAGNPHISYYDATNRNLKYAERTGSAWSISTVDSTWGVGLDTSLALDSAGNPHISYYDWWNGDLKYKTRKGGIWYLSTVDAAGVVGEYTSIALDSAGNPHISYYDYTNGDLKYAKWTGSAWSISTVDAAGVVGVYTSLALDSAENPRISYYDYDHLKYAWYSPNPVPTLSSISPTAKNAGDPGFTLTVTGTGYNTLSKVRWNGADRTTTYLSPTQLSAFITYSDITTAGTASVTVFNPTPGGGTSAALTFSINNPIPTLSSISPTAKTVGDPGFTLTVTGTGFNTQSKVRWNGGDRTTTYLSPTQLSASIPAADIATPGTASVTVFNPTPGGGTSAAQTFTINNPVPTLSSISPTAKNAGDPGFTLTVTGTGFTTLSKVRWNGGDRTTTYLSPTQLSASIPAADIATLGTASVTVFNPTPGGGTTAAQTFTINNPVPTLTSINPTAKNAGDPGFTLTVTGTGYNTQSKVQWNGADRTTTYLSPTQLSASITAADIATPGTASVTVFNPTPGGGTSAPQTFTINNPVPTLSSISPTAKNAGDPGFTLTVTGTGFTTLSKVRWNGGDRTTTYLSPTQLSASIPAADIATLGTASVTVFNPTPGGGTSAALTFTISGTSITVATPNGGEIYYLGSPLLMSWTYTGTPGPTVNIEVLRSGILLKTIPGIPIGSGGSGSFVVAAIPSGTPVAGDYRIRITSASNPTYSDTSDGPFTITGPLITVTGPDGGETYSLGSPLPMSWTYTGNPGPTVTIEVLRSGILLKTIPGISTGVGGSGSYTVPAIPYGTPLASDYQIRVTSAMYASSTDTSNGYFTIAGPTITVTVPNGGETYSLGSPLPMSWTYTGTPGPTVNIEVLRSGSVLKTIPGISTGVGGSGSFTVPTIPYSTPLASDYQIRVTSASYPPCTDTSNGAFTISSL